MKFLFEYASFGSYFGVRNIFSLSSVISFDSMSTSGIMLLNFLKKSGMDYKVEPFYSVTKVSVKNIYTLCVGDKNYRVNGSIYEMEDDWYLVSVTSNLYKGRYFKCDQVNGVINLLNDISSNGEYLKLAGLDESIGYKNTVQCKICGWEWDIDDGGEDKYLCHKCGFDNMIGDYDMDSFNRWKEDQGE